MQSLGFVKPLAARFLEEHTALCERAPECWVQVSCRV